MTEAEDRLEMAMEAFMDVFSEHQGQITAEVFEGSTDMMVSLPTNISPNPLDAYPKFIEVMELLLKAYKDCYQELLDEQKGEN